MSYLILKDELRQSSSSGWAIVSHNQTFRLTAEGLESMAAFIGQGLPMRPFDQHVKQPITVSFVQRHVSGRGNVATVTDSNSNSVKLSVVLNIYIFFYFTLEFS